MILPFPQEPKDWLIIWQATKTMTLLSNKNEITSIPILNAEQHVSDNCGHVTVAKITVSGGVFYVSFQSTAHKTKDTLTYFIPDNNPKAGYWNIPRWYNKQSHSQKGDE